AGHVAEDIAHGNARSSHAGLSETHRRVGDDTFLTCHESSLWRCVNAVKIYSSAQMRERIEFRIPEGHASRWLQNSDGVTIGGSVRKFEIDTDDPRMATVEEADRTLRQNRRAFF